MQLHFGFAPPPIRREDFVVSFAGREAVAAVEAWPAWRGGALALTGPPGSGKSHLAGLWAERTGAATLRGEALDATEGAAADLSGPVLVEAADAGPVGEGLFHLLNRAARGEAAVLLTARSAPRTWRSSVPDLRSRLNALEVAELGEPDDAALLALLAVFFEQRQLRPPADLPPYLVRRIERSAGGARTAVERLDEAALAAGRPLSRALAREVLGDGGEADDAPELPFG